MPGSDEPRDPTPVVERPRGSGPADVPVTLMVAAQDGDSSAFARVATHWEPHLRTFIHLVLAGEGDTDRVLAASYLRAYRALPRYRRAHRPGLWLHRIAFLAATDELRRLTRDPRLRHGARQQRSDPLPQVDDAGGQFPTGWRDLDPDQRAILVMIDRTGFDAAETAEALDSPLKVVLGRLAPARQLLSLASGRQADPDDHAALADRTRTALAMVSVPPGAEGFWPTLGSRLLAEQETPAAPTPNPMDRLDQRERSHPATPGFRPVDALAEQAERIRPRRRWQPIAITIVVVAAVGAILAIAVAIGTSSQPADGTMPATELGASAATAQAGSSPLEVEARVTEPGRATDTSTRRYRVTLAPDGSWFVGARGAIEATAYDAPNGVARRVGVVGAGGADPTVLASEATGLSTGAPDPAAEAPAFLHDLAQAGTILRSATTARARPSREGPVPTYTVRREIRTATDGGAETWEIEVRAGDHRIVRVERTHEGRLVRRSTFGSWRRLDQADPALFRPEIPEGVVPATQDHGFLGTDIAGVAILGRGAAVTPAWLPSGYRLAGVMIHPDGRIVSLGFQRGPEHFTISTRDIASVTGWEDPFQPRDGEGEAHTETLRNGRFNGTEVTVTAGAAGDARLWGAADDTEAGPTGLTIAGALTADEALRVAASLR